jgi:hypothetical protein
MITLRLQEFTALGGVRKECYETRKPRLDQCCRRAAPLLNHLVGKREQCGRQADSSRQDKQQHDCKIPLLRHFCKEKPRQSGAKSYGGLREGTPTIVPCHIAWRLQTTYISVGRQLRRPLRLGLSRQPLFGASRQLFMVLGNASPMERTESCGFSGLRWIRKLIPASKGAPTSCPASAGRSFWARATKAPTGRPGL